MNTEYYINLKIKDENFILYTIVDAIIKLKEFNVSKDNINDFRTWACKNTAVIDYSKQQFICKEFEATIVSMKGQ